MTGLSSQMQHLAGLYGVKTSYLDVNNQVKNASRDALLAVLQSLGAEVSSDSDVPFALREKQQQTLRRVMEPVTVVWEGRDFTLNLYLPAALIPVNLKALLQLEDGQQKELHWRIEESAVIDSTYVEGRKFVSVRLYFPGRLPLGYHLLSFILEGEEVKTLVISSPMGAFVRPPDEKVWGVFLPLYALHSQRSWGAGDLEDMAGLMKWTAENGGKIVGTLPLLPSFFDGEKGPGPYLPASRFFWNEFYLSIDKIPELEQCPAAVDLISSAEFSGKIAALNRSHRVDYNHQLLVKRRILERLAEDFYEKKGRRFEEFRRYLDENPRAEEYAAFRAAGEVLGINWHNWPESIKKGDINDAAVPDSIRRYYLYTQWLVREEMQALGGISAERGVDLYLDLPVGVHPYSYDIWSQPDLFVQGASGGAPPDPLFTGGQDWGFPPLHPEAIRCQGYRYFIDSIRHQLSVAGMLRIDHIMQFHRLFWIPGGQECSEGLYVVYRPEEFFAILALESCRHEALIVGEDLGMVPPEVRPMMEKHGIYRMFIGQYDLAGEGQAGQAPVNSVCSLNTHDMFPFASFWEEKDIAERLKLKQIDARQAQIEMEQRRNTKRSLISILQYRGLDNEIDQDTLATLKAFLELLAAAPAYALLVNLEDLWLEPHPQNIPGTRRAQNWSRKARYALESFTGMTRVTDMLALIDSGRKGKPV
ncbi:MAG: 4-alpha-glucanotransferase [Dehalococcoidales bacterium]|nr:4-alpha-glucanotransferase [Dehalococcoidales bacterium]